MDGGRSIAGRGNGAEADEMGHFNLRVVCLLANIYYIQLIHLVS